MDRLKMPSLEDVNMPFFIGWLYGELYKHGQIAWDTWDEGFEKAKLFEVEMKKMRAEIKQGTFVKGND